MQKHRKRDGMNQRLDYSDLKPVPLRREPHPSQVELSLPSPSEHQPYGMDARHLRQVGAVDCPVPRPTTRHRYRTHQGTIQVIEVNFNGAAEAAPGDADRDAGDVFGKCDPTITGRITVSNLHQVTKAASAVTTPDLALQFTGLAPINAHGGRQRIANT